MEHINNNGHTGDFFHLCKRLMESQCREQAWLSWYLAECELGRQLYEDNRRLNAEKDHLHILLASAQERIAQVTKENQRLNLLMGHLMPRDLGPTTTYQNPSVEQSVTEQGSEVEPDPDAESERRELVQKLETIVEVSDNPSPPQTPRTTPE
ncbi:hypothetical protein ACHAPT_006226 [Fusarium lateritium]